jgi:hypothetical protein
MYAEMMATLFSISICAIPALWLVDKAFTWALNRWS